MNFFSNFLLFTTPMPFTILMGIVGLLVGSFLNVVIYRLPIMMQQKWRYDCFDYLQIENSDSVETFNLALPKSACPNCKTPILTRHNIPILSYLLLRGKCATCHAPISSSYPFIELLTALASMTVAWHFGYSEQAVASLILTWSLIALSGIDLNHQLLPDVIVLPMIWLGLILSLFHIFIGSESSIIGTVTGYLTLWSVYHSFKLFTGKEGMGHGDFKLLAMLGAWIGWQYLGLIILLSSLVGVMLGLTLISLNRQKRETPIPFGPYLAVAGWIALLWGDKLNAWYGFGL